MDREVVTIEAYKDGDRWIVAALDDDRDELFLEDYGTAAEARAVVDRLVKRYPYASGDIQIGRSRTKRHKHGPMPDRVTLGYHLRSVHGAPDANLRAIYESGQTMTLLRKYHKELEQGQGHHFIDTGRSRRRKRKVTHAAALRRARGLR